MITVNILAFATLRRFMPEQKIGEPKVMQIPEGTTFAELRDILALPEAEVKVVMRNNIHVDFDGVAEDGDRIAYIPAVAGG